MQTLCVIFWGGLKETPTSRPLMLQASKPGTSDTTFSKAVPPKGFITFPDNNTIWRPSVQLHEPMGYISHSNHRSQMILL